MRNCSRDQIELRAYQLWQDRGRPGDTAEIDWLEAETELTEAEPAFAKAARWFGTVLGFVVATVKGRAGASLPEKHLSPLSLS